MQDRRQSGRKSLTVEVECHTASAVIKAYVKNIGALGVYVETDTPPLVGSHLRLVLELPGGEKIEAEGVVAHRQTGKGMGVAFVSIGAEAVNSIRSYVEDEER